MPSTTMRASREIPIQERMEMRKRIGLVVFEQLAPFFPKELEAGKDYSLKRQLRGAQLSIGTSAIMKDARSLAIKSSRGTTTVDVDSEGHLVFMERDTRDQWTARSRRNDPDEIRSFVSDTLRELVSSATNLTAT